MASRRLLCGALSVPPIPPSAHVVVGTIGSAVTASREEPRENSLDQPMFLDVYANPSLLHYSFLVLLVIVV